MNRPTFKLITKEGTGLPWDSKVKVNYFRCILIFDGVETDPNTIWSKSEEDAISETLRWLEREWRAAPKVIREYEGYAFPATTGPGLGEGRTVSGYYQVREPR